MYDLFVYIHILAAFAWAAALTMGALCTSCIGQEVVKRFVAARAAAGIVVMATGLYVAISLGFPVWTHMALGLALIVAVLEALGGILSLRSAERGARVYRRTVHVTGALLLAILYLMVFKPG